VFILLYTQAIPSCIGLMSPSVCRFWILRPLKMNTQQSQIWWTTLTHLSHSISGLHCASHVRHLRRASTAMASEAAPQPRPSRFIIFDNGEDFAPPPRSFVTLVSTRPTTAARSYNNLVPNHSEETRSDTEDPIATPPPRPLATNPAAAMGRSLRSSRTKANNSKLRGTVFGPREAERTQRLSARAQAIANQPRPDVAMNEDQNGQEQAETQPEPNEEGTPIRSPNPVLPEFPRYPVTPSLQPAYWNTPPLHRRVPLSSLTGEEPRRRCVISRKSRNARSSLRPQADEGEVEREGERHNIGF